MKKRLALLTAVALAGSAVALLETQTRQPWKGGLGKLLDAYGPVKTVTDGNQVWNVNAQGTRAEAKMKDDGLTLRWDASKRTASSGFPTDSGATEIIRQTTYDAKGCPIRSEAKGPDGKPLTTTRKCDAQGYILEESLKTAFTPDSLMLLKWVWSKDHLTAEISEYGVLLSEKREERLSQQMTHKYNRQGDLIMVREYLISQGRKSKDLMFETAYEYKYDQRGNWISRRKISKEFNADAKATVDEFTLTRKITYW